MSSNNGNPSVTQTPTSIFAWGERQGNASNQSQPAPQQQISVPQYPSAQQNHPTTASQAWVRAGPPSQAYIYSGSNSTTHNISRQTIPRRFMASIELLANNSNNNSNNTNSNVESSSNVNRASFSTRASPHLQILQLMQQQVHQVAQQVASVRVTSVGTQSNNRDSNNSQTQPQVIHHPIPTHSSPNPFQPLTTRESETTRGNTRSHSIWPRSAGDNPRFEVPNRSSNSNNQSQNPAPQPRTSVRPQFRSKVVCQLSCKYCQIPVCRRGMKAILLADTNVELYSTDSPPAGVQLVNDDYITRNCHCRIRDVACLGCGNVVGYHVTQPCETCLEACNNGHFWMFHVDQVGSTERLDATGTKTLLWAHLPRADRDIDSKDRYELMCR